VDIVVLTERYEDWLRRQVPSSRKISPSSIVAWPIPDPFAFFRATYYRWAQVVVPQEEDVPGSAALAICTWRTSALADNEGRLCWGVNDFDEADTLPYTADLVRLAASAAVAKVSGRLP